MTWQAGDTCTHCGRRHFKSWRADACADLVKARPADAVPDLTEQERLQKQGPETVGGTE